LGEAGMYEKKKRRGVCGPYRENLTVGKDY